MTKEEFEKQFTQGVSISPTRYKQKFVTLPCLCGDKNCPGWAAVPNEEQTLKVHKILYLN